MTGSWNQTLKLSCPVGSGRTPMIYLNLNCVCWQCWVAAGQPGQALREFLPDHDFNFRPKAQDAESESLSCLTQMSKTVTVTASVFKLLNCCSCWSSSLRFKFQVAAGQSTGRYKPITIFGPDKYWQITKGETSELQRLWWWIPGRLTSLPPSWCQEGIGKIRANNDK